MAGQKTQRALPRGLGQRALVFLGLGPAGQGAITTVQKEPLLVGRIDSSFDTGS